MCLERDLWRQLAGHLRGEPDARLCPPAASPPGGVGGSAIASHGVTELRLSRWNADFDVVKAGLGIGFGPQANAAGCAECAVHRLNDGLAVQESAQCLAAGLDTQLLP